MSRKNLSGLTGHDILLVWQHENDEGKDVYAIHTVIDYKVGKRPLGFLTLGPEDKIATVERSSNQTGRFYIADNS